MKEGAEEVVIVGAGIAGLTTALGLHKLGHKSLVLESWDTLRITGYAFSTWPNAWKALDTIGLGDYLRQYHARLLGLKSSSTNSGLQTSEITFQGKGTQDHEVRCTKRKELLEGLEKALPDGTIKYSSKVVSIEESGHLKLIHLADGSIIKTKVLIGCDGVNSVVGKWLGLKKPAFAGRSAIRGFVYYKSNHGFEPFFFQFFGKGVRSGFIPCDEKTMYWFFTYTPLAGQEKELETSPSKMKEFVLSKLGKAPDSIRAVVENTELQYIVSAPLRYRYPWELLWGNISKGNVCVAGDALHPMTPDLGQGGCSALEDGVVLARCLGDSLSKNMGIAKSEKEEYENISIGLKKYSQARRKRAFDLISTSYLVGFIQQSDGILMTFARDKLFSALLAGLLLKRTEFDCGKLTM